MRKILAILGSFIAATFLLTSCLGDDDDAVYSSNASIIAFSINDIATKVPSTTSSGEDTTITVTVDGGAYTFSIDQRAGQIYNSDSLPKGTDITKVSVNISTDGYYILYGEDDEAYSSGDSIDFTTPVKFSVYAYDGVSTKSYYVRLNVHQNYPDSLEWHKISDSEFPGNSIWSQKALILNERVYVFTMSGRNLAMTYTDVSDGMHWTSLVPSQGINGMADCSTVVVFSGEFYTLAEGILYRSADGIQWRPIPAESLYDRIVAATNDCLYVMQGNHILSVTETGEFADVQSVDMTIFPESAVAINTPLLTNPAIERSMLVGVPNGSTDSCAVVWSKLSLESQWTYYNRTIDNMNGCPVLENLAVIAYDGGLYAFGGQSLYRKEVVTPFETIFVSRDNGITWWRTDRNIGFPEELKGYEGNFSYVVDENNFIWLMCSRSNTIFRGRINRLG